MNIKKGKQNILKYRLRQAYSQLKLLNESIKKQTKKAFSSKLSSNKRIFACLTKIRLAISVSNSYTVLWKDSLDHKQKPQKYSDIYNQKTLERVEQSMNFFPYWMYTANNYSEFLWVFENLPNNQEIPSSSTQIIQRPIMNQENQVSFLHNEVEQQQMNKNVKVQDLQYVQKLDRSPQIPEEQNISINKTVHKLSKSGKKTKLSKFDDPDFILRNPSIARKYQQTPGRNQLSNVFRAFLRLNTSKSYKQYLKKQFATIQLKYKLSLSLEQFSQQLSSSIPNYTNYINKSQFRRFYTGNGQFNIVFRVMFHKYTKNSAINYITTVRPKKRINKQSIAQFLGALNKVENQLNPDQQSE